MSGRENQQYIVECLEHGIKRWSQSYSHSSIDGYHFTIYSWEMWFKYETICKEAWKYAYLTAMSLQAIWSLLHTNVENDLHNNLTMTFINIAIISKVSNVKYSIFTCKTIIINMLHFKQKKNLIVIANNKH